MVLPVSVVVMLSGFFADRPIRASRSKHARANQQRSAEITQFFFQLEEIDSWKKNIIPFDYFAKAPVHCCRKNMEDWLKSAAKRESEPIFIPPPSSRVKIRPEVLGENII